MPSLLTTLLDPGFVLLGLLFTASLAIGQNCYYPNGIVDASQSACFPGDDASPCCPQNWQCLSNG